MRGSNPQAIWIPPRIETAPGRISHVNVKRARLLLGAAVTLFLLWVGVLIAMAVFSARRPPERIVRPMPRASVDPRSAESR